CAVTGYLHHRGRLPEQRLDGSVTNLPQAGEGLNERGGAPHRAQGLDPPVGGHGDRDIGGTERRLQCREHLRGVGGVHGQDGGDVAVVVQRGDPRGDAGDRTTEGGLFTGGGDARQEVG